MGLPDPADLDVTFVCGLHRSGTSLLHRILRDHPDVSGFEGTGVAEDEGQLLQDEIPTAGDVGGAGKFGFKDGGHLTGEHRLAGEETARQVLEDWAPYWDLGAPRLVEKSPPNVVRTRLLQALFPKARFVVLLRHPVPTSLSTLKWSTVNPLVRLVAHWVRCHELLDEDRRHLDRFHVVKYEDLVEAPDAVAGDLWDFLDVESMAVEQEVRPDVNERYFERWRERREGLLDRLYIRWIEGRYEDRVRRFGYSLRDLDLVEAWPEDDA